MLKRRSPVSDIPRWLGDTAVSPGDRIVLLTYHVARRTGSSRRRSGRLCRDMLRRHLEEQTPARDRRNRARLIAALRIQLKHAGPDVDTAIRDAVLWDEVALLPPRQRYALWAAVVRHDSVAEISRSTGWTPPQVSRLLRAALMTVGRSTAD
ncbi:sigma-70 family RNA polymerase sigma factor [Amycolatopsis sp. CA-128772]|uniref:sigma-70 family RNA polymerase sigma factor n=1 Tax=Amycolatopsis sp. CA-128772 TaxID=2073159 RepID=UPI000CD267CD|nr:sigma-70 family RNA polymerase sigma factor [Amycolatopsis sp. CA-128772]